MSRSKKPDVPKFEPVLIAGYRQEVHSLATPEDERKKMMQEDGSRITMETMEATGDRLQVLHNHLGLAGKWGEHILPLLLAVAEKYVDGFKVHVGAQPKRGAKKVADRFKTVTDVEIMKLKLGTTSNDDAIAAVASERHPRMQATELTTKYYQSRREIVACKPAAELLRFWLETCRTRPDLARDPFFDSLFWQCECEHLGATQAHNVTKLRLQN
jgi:hypothetical protein